MGLLVPGASLDESSRWNEASHGNFLSHRLLKWKLPTNHREQNDWFLSLSILGGFHDLFDTEIISIEVRGWYHVTMVFNRFCLNSITIRIVYIVGQIYCRYSFGRVATLSWKSFSALCQTGTFFQSFSCSRLGRRSLLKASLASLGSRDGR